MKAWKHVRTFFIRFRYPVSMPEEIAGALGIQISNFLTFQEFFRQLSGSSCRPTTLCKYMPREDAEDLFRTALRKEKFSRNSVFSYYFNEGWVEFVLQFDEQARLRRIYLHHKEIPDDLGIEIPLKLY